MNTLPKISKETHTFNIHQTNFAMKYGIHKWADGQNKFLPAPFEIFAQRSVEYVMYNCPAYFNKFKNMVLFDRRFFLMFTSTVNGLRI